MNSNYTPYKDPSYAPSALYGKQPGYPFQPSQGGEANGGLPQHPPFLPQQPVSDLYYLRQENEGLSQRNAQLLNMQASQQGFEKTRKVLNLSAYLLKVGKPCARSSLTEELPEVPGARRGTAAGRLPGAGASGEVSCRDLAQRRNQQRGSAVQGLQGGAAISNQLSEQQAKGKNLQQRFEQLRKEIESNLRQVQQLESLQVQNLQF